MGALDENDGWQRALRVGAQPQPRSLVTSGSLCTARVAVEGLARAIFVLTDC